MLQDQYKNDRKNKLPKFSNKTNEENNTPRKGPKFSIYWVYAIIFAVLIGFQFFNGSFSSGNTQINQSDFEQMLKSGDLEKYTIISNRNVVRVKLKKDAFPKYETKLKNAKA